MPLLFVLLSGTAFAEDTVLNASQQQLMRQLSHRDAAPPCTELENTEGQLQPNLMVMVTEVTQPPWVGMRAANCLIERFPVESKETFQEWMRSEQTMGLAYLLGAQLSVLPTEVAIDVGRVGLSGPHAEGVKKRLQSQDGPVIDALLPSEAQ